MQDIDNIISYTRSLRLLYVEDDTKSHASILDLLENFFDHIVVAVDGEDGLQKFKAEMIDLVMTDINMPKVNGLEMIKAIREVDISVPIIILSAHIEPQYFTQSIKMRVKGYLIKPLELDAMLELFGDIVASMMLRDEIANREKLKEKHHNYLKSIINSVHDPIMVIKENYEVELMNESALRCNSDLHNANNTPAKCYEMFHQRSTPCTGEDHTCLLRSVMDTKKSQSAIHKYQDNNGKVHQMELIATPLFDEDRRCIGIVESTRDITHHLDLQATLHQQKEKLHYLAYHDNLTDLANRVLFEEHVEQAISRAERQGERFALFFIDLNKFKQINDTLGHKVGDKVLQIISKVIQQQVRKEDTLARIGGDEFTLLMERVKTTQDTYNLAHKILHAIEQPIIYDKKELLLSASIGIAYYPKDATKTEELIRYADIAMYKAKKSSEKIIFFQNDER